MRNLPALLAAVLVALATPALAHVTTTVAPLSGPLAVGVPTQVEVSFSEPCFEVVPQEAQGLDSVMAGLHPDAPAAITWTGETVPFTMDQCDPLDVPGYVRATAILTITATADAPGLTNLTLPVASYLGGEGAEPGDSVDLDATIAHYGNGTLTTTLATGAHAGHAGHGQAIELILEYTTNAESLLTFEATSSTGEVHEVDATRVTPPSFGNASSAEAEAIAIFEPPAGWTDAALTFSAYLTPVAGGARIPVGNAALDLHNDEAEGEHREPDGHDHAEDSRDAPAPAFALVGLALLACAARRR